jgi:hypothetical protein
MRVLADGLKRTMSGGDLGLNFAPAQSLNANFLTAATHLLNF